jgi:arginine N-succinyltransferase
MLFIRPATLSDLDALERMARAARPVLHSLPHDRKALEARVALSEDSFRAQVDYPGEEVYLFVLEDSATGQLVGTSSIIASAGYAAPFYVFRNDALIHASRELHVSRKIHALTMSHELTGKSRLAGFYVDASVNNAPDAHIRSLRPQGDFLRGAPQGDFLRGGGQEASGDGDAATHLLSRARMMYIAANRRRFSSEVFSLLLGVTDEAGTSPFWEAVGRKFFGRDFSDIEKISGGRSATFIAEVMPSYPLYVPLLPETAQRVLGEPNAKSLRAYDIHLEEGFEPDRFVDIFDAGPVLTVQVHRAACVTHNETRIVQEVHEPGAAASVSRASATTVRSDGTAAYLVASNRARDFRCVLAELPESKGLGAPLASAARAVLGVVHGDPVYCVPLRRPLDDAGGVADEADAGAAAAGGARADSVPSHSGARR